MDDKTGRTEGVKGRRNPLRAALAELRNHPARTRTWTIDRRRIPRGAQAGRLRLRTRWTVVWVRHDRGLDDLALTKPPARPVETGLGDVQAMSPRARGR